MSDTPDDASLGEILVLMAGAHRSFDTLQGELRTWRHEARSHEAWTVEHARHAGGSGQLTMSIASTDDAPPPPPESEQRTRFWIARPDRVREEWADGAEPGTFVQDGVAWWWLGPYGALTNNGSAEMQHGSRLDSALLDPADLLSWRDLEIIGSAEHAGRDAICVRSHASPRAAFHAQRQWHHGAWPQELLVDRERGVLLRIVSLHDGQPFAISEFTALTFDEQIPGEVFVFEAPPGVEIRDAREQLDHVRTLPLDELARSAPFGVFAFEHVPSDWTMTAQLVLPLERYDWPASVAIRYSDGMSRINLSVSQQAVDEEGLPALAPDGSEWQIVQLPSGELRLWEPSEPEHGMLRMGLTVIAGTRIQITTGDLDLAAIADLAARLAPAPQEPPAVG